MKKLILGALLLMMVATIFIFSNSGVNSTKQTVSKTKEQELINLAKKKYDSEKAKGTKMDNGPCLGMIAIGWVADIAHNPRIPADDEPQNQCEDFRTGVVKNFIELDPAGNFIRSN